MKIEWSRKCPDAEIYEAKTDTKFKVQIAPSTQQGEYAWVIFHQDSGCAQWGGGELSIEKSKTAAQQWLMNNKETWEVTNPK